MHLQAKNLSLGWFSECHINLRKLPVGKGYLITLKNRCQQMKILVMPAILYASFE